MMTAEEYIASVIDRMPRGTPMHAQIAMELRGHIAERVGQRRPLDEVLRQLGDPEKLAESYLSAVPLVSAPVAARIGAKLVDALASLVILAPLLFLCFRLVPPPPDVAFNVWLCVAGLLGGGVVLAIYTMLAESSSDQTIGKRLFGSRVVRESGSRISGWQAIVRQLPFFVQVIWIDALFALFTDRRQRAFELLSKTRVVLVAPEETS
jgi:uncharacterized RDD family membrane protein YckC